MHYCPTCPFCERSDTGSHCRLNPPTVVVTGVSATGKPTSFGSQPTPVNPDDWCGHHPDFKLSDFTDLIEPGWVVIQVCDSDDRFYRATDEVIKATCKIPYSTRMDYLRKHWEPTQVYSDSEVSIVIVPEDVPDGWENFEEYAADLPTSLDLCNRAGELGEDYT